MLFPITEKELTTYYVIDKISVRQIAKIYQCSHTNILYYLKKFNITRRSQSEYMTIKNPTQDINVRDKMSNSAKARKVKCNFKGGKRFNNGGYVEILDKNNSSSNKQGYILEHRLIMEKSLGRKLSSTEIVHHIDGNKKNNNIDNLMLCKDRKEHNRIHKLAYDFIVKIGKLKGFYKYYESKI